VFDAWRTRRDPVHGSTGNIAPSPRTIAYVNVNSVDNVATRFVRPRYLANPDFTPLAPLGDDCLAALA
jgi:ectoine hydroxylase